MLSSLPKTKKYIVFRHVTASLSDTNFTKLLTKNGVLITSIPVTVVLATNANLYTASFTDDGTDNCHWALNVYETSAPANGVYREAWLVRADTTREAIGLIRANTAA